MSWLLGLQNGWSTDVIHLPHAYHNEQAEEACNTQSGQEIEMLSTSLVLFITCKSSSVYVGLVQNQHHVRLNLNLKSRECDFVVWRAFLLSLRGAHDLQVAVFTFSHKSRTSMFHMFGLPRHFNFYIQSDCHFIEASEVSIIESSNLNEHNSY